MDTSTFESWLTKGLGRSAVFLEEHDGAPYRNALLNACLHNVTYDAQLEDARTPYLWRLIKLSKQQAFFRSEVSKRLTERDDDPNECDWPQLFGLARLFAAEGDAEMRLAMYSAFERLGFENADALSAREFIELDGLDGFVFAASRFDILNRVDEIWEIDWLIMRLEERLGKESARELMAQAACRNQTLAAVLEAVRQSERRYAKAKGDRGPRAAPTYRELKSGKATRGWARELRRWAKTATPEQMEVAGEDFLFSKDAEKI
jgi:hypothetical protein